MKAVSGKKLGKAGMNLVTGYSFLPFLSPKKIKKYSKGYGGNKYKQEIKKTFS